MKPSKSDHELRDMHRVSSRELYNSTITTEVEVATTPRHISRLIQVICAVILFTVCLGQNFAKYVTARAIPGLVFPLQFFSIMLIIFACFISFIHHFPKIVPKKHKKRILPFETVMDMIFIIFFLIAFIVCVASPGVTGSAAAMNEYNAVAAFSFIILAPLCFSLFLTIRAMRMIKSVGIPY